MTGTDRITLTGLRARGRHGCLPAERELGQEFVVDVTLGVDTRPAAAADALSLTVDYGTLARRLVAIVEGEPVNLLETLAQRLADACLSEPLVREVEVTVHKPNAPIPAPFADVAVRIHRTSQAAARAGASAADVTGDARHAEDDTGDPGGGRATSGGAAGAPDGVDAARAPDGSGAPHAAGAAAARPEEARP